MVVIIRRKAKGQILQAVERLAGIFVVPVGNDVAVFGHQLREFPERCLNIGQALEKVQMVGLNIVDHGDGGEEVEEAVAVFTAFHDDGVAVAHAMPGVQQRKTAADHNGGVKLCVHKDMGEHGGRGGFAMGAGDANCIFIVAHNHAPSLRPLKHRDSSGTGGGNFRVIVVDGGGANDAVYSLHVLGVVANIDLNATRDQFIGGHGGIHVRAGNLHAHAAQNQTQRPHRYAADADQMDSFAGNKVIFHCNFR